MRFCGHACFLMPGFWFLGLWSSGPSVTWLFSRGAKSKKTQNSRINSWRNGSPCPCMLDTRVLGWLAEGSLLNRDFLFDGSSTVQLVRVRRISDCRVHILNGHLHHIPLPQGSGDTKEEGTEREKPEGLEGSHQHCLPYIPGMLQPGTLKNCAMVYKICPGPNLSTFWRGKRRAPWPTPIRGATDCQWLPLRADSFLHRCGAR